jgi:hypothetical protein
MVLVKDKERMEDSREQLYEKFQENRKHADAAQRNAN